MSRSVEFYREEFVRELYASYVATLRGSFDRWAKTVKQGPVTEVLV